MIMFIIAHLLKNGGGEMSTPFHMLCALHVTVYTGDNTCLTFAPFVYKYYGSTGGQRKSDQANIALIDM